MESGRIKQAAYRQLIGNKLQYWFELWLNETNDIIGGTIQYGTELLHRIHGNALVVF